MNKIKLLSQINIKSNAQSKYPQKCSHIYFKIFNLYHGTFNKSSELNLPASCNSRINDLRQNKDSNWIEDEYKIQKVNRYIHQILINIKKENTSLKGINKISNLNSSNIRHFCWFYGKILSLSPKCNATFNRYQIKYYSTKPEPNCNKKVITKTEVETTKLNCEKKTCPSKPCTPVEKGITSETKGNCEKKQKEYSKNDVKIPIITKKVEESKEANKSTVNRIQSKKNVRFAICKRCYPKNKLYKFKSPPPWKIWLFSLLGLQLQHPDGYPLKQLCCQKKLDEVKWTKMESYPQPLLEPSKKHSFRTPEQQLAVNRTKHTVRPTISIEKQKDFFIKSLPMKNNKAKWAAKETSNKIKSKEIKLEAIKKENVTIELPCDKVELANGKSRSTSNVSSLSSIQQKTSDFCKTLVDLCGEKTNKEVCERRLESKSEKQKIINTVGKKLTSEVNESKNLQFDVSKHISNQFEKGSVKNKEKGFYDKQFKESKSNFRNRLLTQDDYLNKSKLNMPEHYSCGAGEIERDVIEKRKKQPNSNVVHFKYRDHCMRGPGEEKPTW